MLSRKSVCLVWILGGVLFLGCGKPTAAPTPIEDAKVLLFEGKHDEALAKCNELIRIDEHDFRAFLVRGQIHEKMDDLQSALADYSSAIEVAPKHHEPYDFRYQLYMTLAKRAPQEDVFRLQELAAADRKSVDEFNPEASVAFKNENRQPHPLLDQPIPRTPDKYNSKPVVEDSLLATGEDDKKEEKNEGEPNGFAKKSADDDADDSKAEGEEAGKDEVNEAAADYAARQARDAQDIRVKELGVGEADDLTLPPHLDPETATLPQLPERPITRFSLPTDDQGRLVLPQTTRQLSTGLTSRNESERSEENGEPTGPNSRFFLQNQTLGGPNPFSSLPNQRQGVRTGIGSSRGMGSGGLGPRVGGLQIGFMPPEARNSFGPRLGSPDQQQSPGQPSRRPALPTQSDEPTILTTALPGTSMLYRSGKGSIPNTGNANLDQLQPGGMLRNGMTRSISDPSYTPFGARPALPKAQALPKAKPAAAPQAKPFPVTRSDANTSSN